MTEEEKDKVDAFVNHHVNGPMTVVAGHIQLILKKEELSEEAQERLKKIQETVHKMSGLLRRDLRRWLDEDIDSWSYQNSDSK